MMIAIVGAGVIVAVVAAMRPARIEITVADPDDERWWNVLMCRDLGVPSENLANAIAAQAFFMERFKIIAKTEVEAFVAVETGREKIEHE
ncbi:MAG: hypothetical protein ABI459_06750, partial [Deltaproteobacteria bacterium]